MRRRHSHLLALLIALVSPVPAQSQSMSELLGQLFVFGGGEQLFLAGSAGVEATQVHGDHFIPSEVATNGALLDFFSNSIAINVSSFPLPTTVSSQTYRFVDGVPTPTSNSFGPIIAERAQTVGRGRLNAGVNYSRSGFSKVRGVGLDNIGLKFVHVNVDFEGCDDALGGDCTEFGLPQVENDVIDLGLDVSLNAEIFALYATLGLTDWLDVSVAVPIVNLELFGSSVARITPSTPDAALHFFAGTPEDPTLEAQSQARGSATGLGDAAVRLKARLTNNDVWDLGVLGELRIPTGREEDFLGSGSLNAKGMLIISGAFDTFSPHANLGYEHRGSELDEDEVELILGFDQKLTDWATLAMDLLGTFKLGESPITFPEDVQITQPFSRTLSLTNLPDTRDDVIEGAVGLKFRTGGGLVLISNVIVALNDGGLRTELTPTFGLEYLF